MTESLLPKYHGLGIWHRIGEQLAEPRGLSGLVLAHIMDCANAMPLAEAIAIVKQCSPNDVLEVGFGSGKGTAGLIEACPGIRICGIDRSADMVARAMARNARAVGAGNVQLLNGHANQLPWGVSTFDCVMAVNVAYFFRNAGCETAEIFRVLRPGGKIVLYVTQGDTMRRWPFASRSTHRHFDEGDLKALLTEAAFRDVTISVIPLPLGITGLIATGTKPEPLLSISETR